jgi:monoamine oxidase
MQTEIAIIGAGLSGLYAAYLLHQQGHKVTVFEARDRIGGRIVSLPLSDDNNGPAHQRYDLGPSWFWPDMHPHITSLLDALEIKSFPQHQQGAHIFDRGRHAPPQRYDLGMMGSPQSMRVVGGMYSLIEALANTLPDDCIRLNSTLTSVTDNHNDGVVLTLEQADKVLTVQAQAVILALPPRVLVETVNFSPELPAGLNQHLANTMTWMGAHAKFVAVYETNFWREQGLSGSASSQTGPLMEIHDASAYQGKPALFGFVGLNAAARKSAGREQLIKVTLGQLGHLFGEQAAQPKEVFLIDWSDEQYTATVDDHAGAASHPTYGLPPEAQELWNSSLVFAGTESASIDGGYLEGALNAAEQAINNLKL